MGPAKKYTRTVYRILIDERTFVHYLLSFVAIVVVFGVIYAFLPSSHGLEPREPSSLPSEILRGLYFSIVTISSLGYGDLQPVGLSRAFAGLEVVMGLALIGIMIAKLTSERVSHLVSSIYVSDAQRKLNQTASLFNVAGYDIQHTSQALSIHYQQVPQAPQDEAAGAALTQEYSDSDLKDVKVQFNSAVSDFRKCTREFRDYLFQATDRGRYLQLIPDFTLENLAKAMESALSALNRSIITLYSSSDSDTMDPTLLGVPRAYLSEIVEIHKRASNLIASESKNGTISSAYQELSELCDNISVALGQVPEEEAPDQLYQGDEPLD